MARGISENRNSRKRKRISRKWKRISGNRNWVQIGPEAHFCGEARAADSLVTLSANLQIFANQYWKSNNLIKIQIDFGTQNPAENQYCLRCGGRIKWKPFPAFAHLFCQETTWQSNSIDICISPACAIASLPSRLNSHQFWRVNTFLSFSQSAKCITWQYPNNFGYQGRSWDPILNLSSIWIRDRMLFIESLFRERVLWKIKGPKASHGWELPQYCSQRSLA